MAIESWYTSKEGGRKRGTVSLMTWGTLGVLTSDSLDAKEQFLWGFPLC